MADDSYWLRLRNARRGRRAVLRGGAIAGAGLAAAGLVGCGSSANNNKTAGGSAAQSTSVAAATSAGAATATPAASAAAKPAGDQPRPGGVISQRLASDPPALDIHQVSTYVAVFPEAPCYNQLLQIDTQDPSDTKIVADLADKWETTDNGQTVIFHLHPGVKFHDGSAFTLSLIHI